MNDINRHYSFGHFWNEWYLDLFVPQLSGLFRCSGGNCYLVFCLCPLVLRGSLVCPPPPAPTLGPTLTRNAHTLWHWAHTQRGREGQVNNSERNGWERSGLSVFSLLSFTIRVNHGENGQNANETLHQFVACTKNPNRSSTERDRSGKQLENEWTRKPKSKQQQIIGSRVSWTHFFVTASIWAGRLSHTT